MEGDSSLTRKRSFGETSVASHNDSPPRKITRLDVVSLPLSDERHRAMDQEVIGDRHVKSLPSQLDLYGAVDLLVVIVTRARNVLNRTDHLEAEKLIKDNPGLLEELQNAWKAQSFARIRRLAILQANAQKTVLETTPSPERRRRLLDKELRMDAILSAWKQPYRGSYHRLLYDNINVMERSKPYTNTVAIVQSSGTGKSRMVHEQSNLVFTIPFNLRADADSRDLAYPGPDQAVRSHLVQYPSQGGFTGLQTYYYDFLRHLFAKVREELTSLYENSPIAATYEEVATLWRKHLESGVRDELYGSVVKTAYKSSIKDVGEDNADARLSRSQSEAKQELAALISCLDKIVHSKAREDIRDGVKLVLYFDEAHILTNNRAPPNPENKDLYDVLCSCFDFFIKFPIFVIYLSTNSRLDKFAPDGTMARSARARANADSLQAPITEVPFDCVREFIVRPRQYTLEKVCQVEFMCKFGRPLFWTLLEGGKDNQNIVSTIIDLARSKLICSHEIRTPPDLLSGMARLAVCDVRLMFDFEPRRETLLHAEAELVASHMRIAYSVPQNRVYLRSGYPSEPLLAEAAAQQMYTFRNHKPSAVLNILSDYMKNGLLDRGEGGEIVARTLLMLAYDRAVERDHPPNHPGTPPLYSKGCGAITFIEELFSEECASEVLDSVPDNLKQDTTLREAFKSAKVRFTHFVKWRDDSGMTTEAMCASFVRAMAVVCHSGNATVDIVIPVLLRDEPLCEEVMTGMLIQVKRRMKAGTVQAYAIDAKNLAFFPALTGTSSNPRPYITLIMELGVQNALPPLAKILTKSKQSRAARKTVPKATKFQTTQATPSKIIVTQQGRLKPTTATPPRYSIFAYGCSSTVYKVIESGQKGEYAFLLASRDFLAEHPRQTPHSLEAVRKMKPFWAVGDECFHWYDSKSLNVSPVENPDYEGWLVTGSLLESEEEAGFVDDGDDFFMDENV